MAKRSSNPVPTDLSSFNPKVQKSLIFSRINGQKDYVGLLITASPSGLVSIYFDDQATETLQKDVREILAHKVVAPIEAWVEALKADSSLNAICEKKILELLPKTVCFPMNFWIQFLHGASSSRKFKQIVLSYIIRQASFEELSALKERAAWYFDQLMEGLVSRAKTPEQKLEILWTLHSHNLSERLMMEICTDIRRSKDPLTPEQTILLYRACSPKTALHWWAFNLAIDAFPHYKNPDYALYELKCMRDRTFPSRKLRQKNRPKFRRRIEQAALKVIASKGISYTDVVLGSLYYQYRGDLRAWYPHNSPERERLTELLVEKALRGHSTMDLHGTWSIFYHGNWAAAVRVAEDLSPWPSTQERVVKELAAKATVEDLWYYLKREGASDKGVILPYIWTEFLAKASLKLVYSAWFNFPHMEGQIMPWADALLHSDPEAKKVEFWIEMINSAPKKKGPAYVFAVRQLEALTGAELL